MWINKFIFVALFHFHFHFYRNVAIHRFYYHRIGKVEREKREKAHWPRAMYKYTDILEHLLLLLHKILLHSFCLLFSHLISLHCMLRAPQSRLYAICHLRWCILTRRFDRHHILYERVLGAQNIWNAIKCTSIATSIPLLCIDTFSRELLKTVHHNIHYW